MKLLLAALAAATLVLPLTACDKAPAPAAGRETAFERKVRDYLLEHPEVIEEAIEKLQDKKRAEAQQAALADAAHARAALPKHRAALERDPRDLVANPDGRITVVEFFDYNCGYCKVVAPEVMKLIAENPDVRFVFKEFPIFGEASDTAARVALTPGAKAKGLELHQAWMAQKPLDEAAIDRTIKAAGLDPAVLREQAQSPEITRQVADVRELAMALKIQGTPAFIIGDTIIPGADVEALKAAIARAKAG